MTTGAKSILPIIVCSHLAAKEKGHIVVKSKSIEAKGALTLGDVISFFDGHDWRSLEFRFLEKIELPRVPIFSNSAAAETLLKGIGEASKLLTLDLTETKLTDAHFRALARVLSTTITHLHLSGNEFQSVPHRISYLRKLKSLHVAGPKLEYVPGVLSSMQTELVLHPSDRLRDPPVEVQKKGSRAVKEYLSDPHLWWLPKRLSVAVLGHSEAGKTSLVKALSAYFSYRNEAPKQPISAIPKQVLTNAQVINLQSTTGVVEQKWLYRTDEMLNAAVFFSSDENSVASQIEFQVLDFAGQLEYLTTHKYFLPVVDAVYILVTDLTQTIEKQTSQLRHWLDLLQARFDPEVLETEMDYQSFVRCKYTVILVGTKLDLCTGNKEQIKRGFEELRNLAKERMSSSVEAHIVSSLTGTGLTELFGLIAEIGEEYTKWNQGNIPRVVRHLDAIVTHMAQQRIVVTTRTELQKELIIRSKAATTRSEYLFSRSLKELAKRGIVLCQPDSERVWLCPALISQVMALFICPLSHKLRYFSQLSQPVFGGAVVPVEDALKRLRTLPDFASISNEDGLVLLRSLRELDLCFELDSAAKQSFGVEGFLFPSLRSPGQLHLIHPSFEERAEASRPKSDNVQYVARVYRVQRAITAVDIYFRLQVMMKDLLDLRYKLYMNSMLLRDRAQNRALVVSQDGRICVIVCGASPRWLLGAIEGALRVAAKRAQQNFQTAILCPMCAQGICLYTPLNADGQCKLGHSIPVTQILEPLPASAAHALLNDIWSPPDRLALRLGEWQEQGPLRWTVLRNETQQARESEYLRAKDLFYKFTSRDKLANYELDRVVLLQNEDLERSFAANLMKLLDHHMRLSTPETTTLPGSEDELRWRNWMLEHFNNYVSRLSSNTNLNLVAGWHGTAEETCFKIATTNFREPSEITTQTDPGYFGKGIYFTQYPSYSAKYSGATQCILLSWIAMGRVYPIIESPIDPVNFLGKSCHPGFDSHYVVVKKMNETSYFPCKPNETPEYDELVVFRKAQILPRYLFYFRRFATESFSSQKFKQAGVDLLAQPTVSMDDIKALNVLWVDDKPFGEHVHLMGMWMKQAPSIFYKDLGSTEELRVWLSLRTAALTRRGESCIRIITNRYRERDGGAAAAELLIKWVRNESAFPRTPILVYCSSTNGLNHLQDRLTVVTNDIRVCQHFATSLLEPFMQTP